MRGEKANEGGRSKVVNIRVTMIVPETLKWEPPQTITSTDTFAKLFHLFVPSVNSNVKMETVVGTTSLGGWQDSINIQNVLNDICSLP